MGFRLDTHSPVPGSLESGGLESGGVESGGLGPRMLGLGTHLMFDLVWDYFKAPEKLSNWFWMVKRNLDWEEKRWFVGVVVVLYLLIARGL